VGCECYVIAARDITEREREKERDRERERRKYREEAQTQEEGRGKGGRDIQRREEPKRTTVDVKFRQKESAVIYQAFFIVLHK
jgi:hypothetical protein